MKNSDLFLNHNVKISKVISMEMEAAMFCIRHKNEYKQESKDKMKKSNFLPDSLMFGYSFIMSHIIIGHTTHIKGT